MKIVYDTENLDLKVGKSTNLLDVCLRNKVPISHSCEGMASCGTCRIIVTHGEEKLPPRNSIEQEMADDRNFQSHERLACQCMPKSDLSFVLPKDK